jgi:hypothetical protein
MDSRQAQIGQELGLMDRQEPVDGFQLDNNPVFYYHVQSVAAVQAYALVNHGQRLLTAKGESSQPQLVAQAFLIFFLAP